MTPLALAQLLSLYTWFALAALLLIALLIARFYQQFSGEKTHFRWFFVPIVLFGASVLRYNSIDRIVGDPIGEIAAGLSAAILFILSLRLYRQMTHGRRGEPPLGGGV